MIRPAMPGDIAAITAIYAHHVRTGVGSFEIEPPTAAEMQTRFDGIQALNLPYLVAVADDVIGYAYAAPYRARAAYRHTLEHSVYVHPDHVGHGVGRTLMQALIPLCAAWGCHTLIAGIGGGASNAASVGLHTALGFQPCGTLRQVGYKFDAWQDVMFMQLNLEA
jgi:phosphinothricin acetyltransferase